MNIAEKTLQLKQDFDDVYEAGKKAEYDAFWDSIQKTNVSTIGLFAGRAWNDDTFKPKYNIILKNANYCFYNNGVTDLIAALGDLKIDCSKLTQMQNCFQYSAITAIPYLDLSNVTYAPSAFADSKVKTIVGLKLSETTALASNWFTSCTALTHCIFSGVIAKNGFDIHWSTLLDADSLKSIINALSTTTTGLTITLPTTAQSNYEAVYGSGSWSTLTATKSNWTIAYA